MIEFADCSKCTDCPLHESAKHPGIPTRPYSVTGKEQALLIVGEAPGHTEDRSEKKLSWIGYAGQLLDKMIKAAGLQEYADIFLANACRCKPPQGDSPERSHINKCRPYLLKDIETLLGAYKHLTILACGAPATYSISKIKTLAAAFRSQGAKGTLTTPLLQSLPPPMESSCPILFFTYHPAVLHPSRKPALITSVEAHFVLLARYLKGEFIPNEIQVIPEIGTDPGKLKLPSQVCVDIETYGILKGKHQTVFTPIQSKLLDGIEYDKQVITVSIGYRENGNKRTHLYIFEDRIHRQRLEEWFKRIVKEKITLLGQNIKFDLLYLASADKGINYWIDPRWLRLDDTLLLGALLYEQQPEKGMKEVALLFGIADYGQLKVTAKTANAESAYDPNLHYYNCFDVAVTLTLYDELLARIEKRYGKKSNKFSPACADMRNAVLWDTIELERAGGAFSIPRLKEEHNNATAICVKCINRLTSAGIIPHGKGSDRSLREFITQGIRESNLFEDPRVQFTKKKKEISIGKENTNLLLEYIPTESPLYPLLKDFKTFTENSKIVNTYTQPLLENKEKGIVGIKDNGRIGMVYPTWYPVPGYHSKEAGEKEKMGGTIQARITCQRPPLQTLPPVIFGCQTTRFKPGILVEYDMSQSHLRMAALLSGDPLLMGAYEKGLDLHDETTRLIYPNIDAILAPRGETLKDSKERQLCKSINFLVLFRGGAKALQDTARADLGLMLEQEFCDRLIKQWYRDHITFKLWQDSLLDTAATQGYLEVPTGWSRTFAFGYDGIVAYSNEICNFPIQTLDAQVTESAHFQILQRIRECGLQSVISLQRYDSLVVDMPQREETKVDKIVGEALTRPPILAIIEKSVTRSVPWLYSRKVLDAYPNQKSKE